MQISICKYALFHLWISTWIQSQRNHKNHRNVSRYHLFACDLFLNNGIDIPQILASRPVDQSRHLGVRIYGRRSEISAALGNVGQVEIARWQNS